MCLTIGVGDALKSATRPLLNPISLAVKQHPRYLPNQVKKEILFSLEAFPMLDLLTLPWFLGDVRGHSKLYDSIAEGPFGATGGWKPWAYMAASAAVFLFFTDYCIYWIHRWLHIPFFYKRLHKPHHKWIGMSRRPDSQYTDC